jgi:hypothetical protein
MNAPQRQKSGRPPTALLVLFIAGGAALLGLGIKGLISGQPKDAPGMLLAGVMICGIPTLIFFLWRAEQKRLRAAQQEYQANPAPWLARQDWAKGEIVSGENQRAKMFFLSAAVIVVFAAIYSGAFSRDGISGDSIDPLMLIFFGVPALLAVTLGILAVIRNRKFGRSVFKMSTVPGLIGGKLEGIIEVGTRLEPPEGFDVRLLCLNISRSGKHTRRRKLWEQRHTVRSSAPVDDPTHSAIPVSFTIPADCPETDDTNPADQISWQLEARAEVPGVNYLARFEVPVFKPRPGVEKSAPTP